jgi:hypothetical protein
MSRIDEAKKKLKSMKKDGLIGLARTLAIDGFSTMSRKELIEELGRDPEKLVGPLGMRWLDLYLNPLAFGLTVVGLILAIAVPLWQHREVVKTERKTARSGQLAPADPPAIEILRIGGFNYALPQREVTVLADSTGEPLLKINLTENRLLVDAVIRDRNGQLVATMRRNEWDVGPLAYDRNYTDQVLEVLGTTGEVVTQVLLDGNIAIIGADLRCSARHRILFGAYAHEIIPADDEDAPAPSAKLKPICEYPSALHFGSCPLAAAYAASQRAWVPATLKFETPSGEPLYVCSPPVEPSPPASEPAAGET